MSKKMGAPVKELDWEMLADLCQIQCSKLEIAALMKMSEDTLSRRIQEESGETFAEYYKRASAPGKMSLRRAQFKSALQNGNVAMMIWLGKQYLDQRDQNQLEQLNKFQPLVIELDNGRQVKLEMTDVTNKLEEGKSEDEKERTERDDRASIK